MTLFEKDTEARADSLDITRSLIVQAPAGSGKTTLLIQRYLRLLASVDEPESILAMTFTRKAAGEMLARVERALRFAARLPNRPAEPRSLRSLETRSLAFQPVITGTLAR
jgi:ATP-dependent exoDNAse (exonuclease V) beta subunit